MNVGVIGGADGPTSVFVASPFCGFGGFGLFGIFFLLTEGGRGLLTFQGTRYLNYERM